MKRGKPMSRVTPMRRVGFKRQGARLTIGVDLAAPGMDACVLVEVAPGRPPRIERWLASTPAAQVFLPQPKRDYVRSEPLLAAVRRVPFCSICGRHFAGGERADPAHSNWSGHGKAGRIKADDHRIAAACRLPCHAWIDASGDDWFERFDAWWSGHVRTVQYLTARNKWPASVPVPDLTYPEELQ